MAIKTFLDTARKSTLVHLTS